MLRRPLSTVLSSVSIRSALSTRLFCAPAIANVNRIITVRTTGIGWAKNGAYSTKLGVYWGDGDPRNTIERRSNDSTDYRGVRLRSIVKALEQAKKNGLKRIRVQTDFKIEQYQGEYERFKNNEMKKPTEHQISNYVMYSKVVEFMNEMEVIIEYRSPFMENEKGNGVLNLLIEEKKKQFINSNDVCLTHPTCDFVWLTAANVASDEKISTVRTTGMRFRGEDGVQAMSGVYWGEDDPRNTIEVETQNMNGFLAAKLRSIVIALKQAKKDGSKRVRVQTDFELEKYQEMCKKINTNDLMTLTKHECSSYLMYKKCAELMNELEVILEYRSSLKENGKDNEVMGLLFDERKQKEMNSNLVHLPIPNDEVDDQITTVRTTGIRWAKEGVYRTTNAVYWGDGDSRNTIEEISNDKAEFRGVMMRSIVMALEQAKKDNLKRIRVQTDLKKIIPRVFESFENIEMTEQQLFSYKMYKRIVTVMNEMEVILEYRSPWFEEEKTVNEVMKMLHEDKMRKPKKTFSNFVDYTSPAYESDWIITPNGSSSLEGRTIPTVYAVGRVSVRNQHGGGSCASLWEPESIEHLDIQQRPLGSTQRIAMIPLTNFRAQLEAIHDAINEAQSLNLPEIRVITDSLHFMHFFKAGWKNQDESPVANYRMYLHIKALTETIQVHFKGVKLAEDNEDELLAKVHEMVKESNEKPISE